MKVFLGAIAIVIFSLVLRTEKSTNADGIAVVSVPPAESGESVRLQSRSTPTPRPGNQTEGSRIPPRGDAKTEARNRTSDALVLAKSGDSAAALRLLESVTQEEPTNQKAFAELGFLLVESGAGAEKAIPVLQTAVRLDPNDGEALSALNEEFTKSNRLDEGIDFLKSMPDDSASRLALGDLLLKAARPKEAAGYLRKYAETTRTPVVLATLGTALLQSGDSQAAGRTFKEVEALRQEEANEIVENGKEDPVKVAQQMAWTKLDLANVHLEEGNLEAAAALVENVLALFPDDKHALEMKKQLTKKQGT